MESGSGPGGRRFKSSLPDHLIPTAEQAYNEQSGITDEDAPLGTPQTVDVNGDRAYFVAPMTYTYQKHGKPVKETATFAVSLHRTSAGWKITGWAYCKQALE